MTVLHILSRDHAGKRTSPKDLGAWADLDGDGKRQAHETEAMLTPLYGLALERRIRELRPQDDVLWVCDGNYSERHERANAYAKSYDLCVYYSLHLNAGGGSYGGVFYDWRSSVGPKLADAIARRMRDSFSELTKVHTWPTGPAERIPRPFTTIRGLGKPIGLCLEPFFLDHPLHRDELATTNGLNRIGSAIAEGVAAWLDRR